MRKRWLALALASAMAASVCACGSGDAVKEAETTAAPTAKAETATTVATTAAGAEPVEADKPLYPLVAEGEEVTLVGAVIEANTSVSDDRLIWQAVEELTGVNIEWEFIDKDSLNTYLAGSDWPDFFITYSADDINDALMYDYGVLGGRFVNILDHLDDMPWYTQFLEDYPEAKKAFTESNGEMYEFPGVDKMVTAVYSRPYLRTDVLEEAGCEVPTTVDEFYECLVKLKEYYGHEGWIYRNDRDVNTYFPILFGAFGTLTEAVFEDDGSGNVVFVRSSDQMKRYYEFMNKLYEEGLINQECFTIDAVVAKDLELNGGYAFLEYAAESIGKDQLKDGDWSYLTCLEPLTSEYDDTREVMGRMSINSKSGPYMNADSEHVDIMCKIFDMMYSTEEVAEGSGIQGMSFNYGIRGVHWDIDDNGTTYTQYWPDNYATYGDFQMSEITWNNIGRSDFLAGYVTSSEGNAKTRAEAFVDKVWPYVKPGSEVFPTSFLKFTEDEQFVIDQYWSEIKTYYTGMQAKFITGTVDIETGWDEYLKTLDDMGMDQVLEVYQASYNRWLAN